MNNKNEEEFRSKWNEHHQDLGLLVEILAKCQSIMPDHIIRDTVKKLLDNKEANELIRGIEKSGEVMNQILTQEGIMSLQYMPERVLEQAKVMLRDLFQASEPQPQSMKKSPGMK